MECMATLLKFGGFPDCSSMIFRLAYIYEFEPEMSRDSMSGLYGGVGSLNDILLYKDGSLLKKENRELYKLKNDIYRFLFYITLYFPFLTGSHLYIIKYHLKNPRHRINLT